MPRTKEILKKVGHELKKNPPSVLKKTAKKKGKTQAEKQRVAILLSKARKAGANVPQKPSREDVLKRISQKSKEA